MTPSHDIEPNMESQTGDIDEVLVRFAQSDQAYNDKEQAHAAIQKLLEAAEKRGAVRELKVLDYIPDNLGTKVWAQDVYDKIKSRIAALESEKK